LTVRENFKLTEEMKSPDQKLNLQLQEFILTTNEFINNINGQKPYKTLINFVLYLSDYSKNHFLYQESIMHLQSYPSVEEHKAEHIEFIIAISRVFKVVLQKKKITYANDSAMISDHQPVINDLYEFVSNWIDSHVLITDKRFNNFLKFEN